MTLHKSWFAGAWVVLGAWCVLSLGAEQPAGKCRGEGPADAKPTACRAADEFHPDQSRIPTPPPKDAIVLFDGKGTNLFLNKHGQPTDWPVEDGVMTVKSGQRHLHPRQLRDADL